MNKYGRLAKSHWARTDPSRYALISDPSRFFMELGQQAESEIQELSLRLAGPDPPREEYLAKVGRLNMARLQAEEQVLAELILIEAPEDPEEAPDPEAGPDLISDVQKAIHEAVRESDPPG
jgi:hypothetical protein